MNNNPNEPLHDNLSNTFQSQPTHKPNHTPLHAADTAAPVSPYQSPSASLHTEALTNNLPNDKKWYQLSGRIGRLRYLAYMVVMSIIAYVVIMISMGITFAVVNDSMTPDNAVGIVMLAYLPILPFVFYNSIIYPIRRLHDLNQTGWLAILSFIPLLNILFGLYLLFAPGTQGVNKYGRPPRPNTTIHYILALVVPFAGIALIGILAAIALPAYQDYVERSQQAVEMSSSE